MTTCTLCIGVIHGLLWVSFILICMKWRHRLLSGNENHDCQGQETCLVFFQIPPVWGFQLYFHSLIQWLLSSYCSIKYWNLGFLLSLSVFLVMSSMSSSIFFYSMDVWALLSPVRRLIKKSEVFLGWRL